MAKDDFENGVWRTVGGRRIFIEDGEDLETAMKKSGKFKLYKSEEKKHDKKINYNLTENNEKFNKTVKENIDKLVEEYNTPLENVEYISAKEVFKTGEAGVTSEYGKTLKIGQATQQTVYHEFAHTLADQQRYDLLNQNKEFWDGIKKIEKSYYKEEKLIDKKSISSFKEYDPNFNRLEAKKNIEISHENQYYKTDTNEFFAESFANYKLGLTKSPYAKEVVELTDKYFKKKK